MCRALLLLILLPATAQAQAWWDPAWTRRAKVSFDHSGGSGPLTEVPVLLLLDPTRVDYGSTLPFGADLRVVDADGITELEFEIESWDPLGISPVWVKLPELEATDLDHLWLYYGNPGAGPAAPGNVWSNGYEAVYHLADATDATGGWHGVDSGTVAVPGIIGTARFFDGFDDFIDTTHDIDLAEFTVVAWGRSPLTPASGGDNDGLIMREQNYQVNWDHPSAPFAGAASLRNQGNWPSATFGPLQPNTWHLLGNSYDGQTLRAWADGALITENPSPSGPPDATTWTAKIGKHAFTTNQGSPSSYFLGEIDEVRIASVARSEDWMALQHASMSDGLATWCDPSNLALAADADGDGDLCDVDCDDTEPAIGPSQVELCGNGVDDDCDPATDDAGPTWYADDDGDGFGRGDLTAVGCTAPPGFVAVGGDCDDAEPAVNPAEPEGCDGLDNDCNGLTDDADPGLDPGLANPWWADSDGDGYGDPLAPIDACVQPADTVLDDTDCDDGDPSVHPGAVELPGNGVDEDCDGLDGPGTGTSTTGTGTGTGTGAAGTGATGTGTGATGTGTGATGTGTGATGSGTGTATGGTSNRPWDPGLQGEDVEPGPVGCGCATPTHSPAGGWLLGWAPLVLFRRRR